MNIEISVLRHPNIESYKKHSNLKSLRYTSFSSFALKDYHLFSNRKNPSFQASLTCLETPKRNLRVCVRQGDVRSWGLVLSLSSLPWQGNAIFMWIFMGKIKHKFTISYKRSYGLINRQIAKYIKHASISAEVDHDYHPHILSQGLELNEVRCECLNWLTLSNGVDLLLLLYLKNEIALARLWFSSLQVGISAAWSIFNRTWPEPAKNRLDVDQMWWVRLEST